MQRPCVLDEEVSICNLAGLDSQTRAALPEVNLVPFRLNREIDAIESCHNRQIRTLKLDKARSRLKLTAPVHRLGCELSAKITAGPVNGDSKNSIGNRL